MFKNPFGKNKDIKTPPKQNINPEKKNTESEYSIDDDDDDDDNGLRKKVLELAEKIETGCATKEEENEYLQIFKDKLNGLIRSKTNKQFNIVKKICYLTTLTSGTITGSFHFISSSNFNQYSISPAYLFSGIVFGFGFWASMHLLIQTNNAKIMIPELEKKIKEIEDKIKKRNEIKYSVNK